MESHQKSSNINDIAKPVAPRRSCRRSKTRPSCRWCPSPVHALGKSPPALDAHPVARWEAL